MMWKLRNAFANFMQGRNGVDELGRAETWVCLVLIIVSFFVKNMIMELFVLGAIIHMYFRMFSKNLGKRSQENRWFLDKKYALYRTLDKKKRRAEQSKTHCFYTCKGCGQTIRVPRGKGKIEITCPKCQYKFVKKT